MKHWKTIAAIQFSALLMALALPITPSKTGSKWDPAELFFADPSYLQKVAVSFVLANAMIAFVGVIFVIFVRYDRWRESRGTVRSGDTPKGGAHGEGEPAGEARADRRDVEPAARRGGE